MYGTYLDPQLSIMKNQYRKFRDTAPLKRPGSAAAYLRVARLVTPGRSRSSLPEGSPAGDPGEVAQRSQVAQQLA